MVRVRVRFGVWGLGLGLRFGVGVWVRFGVEVRVRLGLGCRVRVRVSGMTSRWQPNPSLRPSLTL